MPDTTPEKVVLVSLPPVVSVPEPRVTFPAPASDPTVSLKLLRARIAPELTVTALGAEKLLVAPPCRTPALTKVAPE